MLAEDQVKFKALPLEEQMAIVMAAEARGESYDLSLDGDEPRLLIGSIIINRVAYGKQHQGWGKFYGTDITSVCLAKNQFSSLNSNDPNYPLVQEMINDFAGVMNEHNWLAVCYADAVDLIDSKIPPIVRGIYYETLASHALWDQLKTVEGHDPVIEATIGHHRVYAT